MLFRSEEIVRQFTLFDSNVKDSVDKKIALLRELRELYNNDRELYHKIKELPMKSRVLRKTGNHAGKTVAFISSEVKTEFYLVNDRKAEVIDFLEAVKYLRAKPEECPIPFTAETDTPHYGHVNAAINKYQSEYSRVKDTDGAKRTDLDNTSREANNFLRHVKQITPDSKLHEWCDILTAYINDGIYARLPRELKAISREYKGDRVKMKTDEFQIQKKIGKLLEEYQVKASEKEREAKELSDPKIIISETFI